MTVVEAEKFKMTALGPLPPEWEVVKLGELLDTLRNGTTKRQNKDGKGYAVSRIETISTGLINPVKVGCIESLTDDEVVNYRLRHGDILFSHINSEPYLGNSAIYRDNPPLLIHGMNLLVVRPNISQLGPEFLNFLFNYYRTTGVFVGIASRAVNQSSINQGKLKALLISLPPLPEQKKIAHVLSTVQTAIEKTEAVIKATRELKKSLMKHLFAYGPVSMDEVKNVLLKETKIGMIPDKWDVVRLGEVVTFSSKPRNFDLSASDNIPFVPMEYIPDDWVDINRYEMRKPGEIRSGTFFFKGDLLVAKITPSFENGKQCIANNLPSNFGYATTEVWPLHQTTRADLLYLFYHLKRKEVRMDIAGKMEGSTGRQRVPRHVLQSLYIPLPSLSIQRQITDMLSPIDGKIEAEESKRKSLEALFETLLSNLMTGKIRVNNLEVPV